MNQNDLIRIDHAPAKRSGCSLPAAEMLDARYAAGEVDLDASIGVGGGSSDLDADWELDAYLDDRFRCDTQSFARRHAQLVEELLKGALSKIRVGVASAGGASHEGR